MYLATVACDTLIPSLSNCSPERVGQAHLPNEVSHLTRRIAPSGSNPVDISRPSTGESPYSARQKVSASQNEIMETNETDETNLLFDYK